MLEEGMIEEDHCFLLRQRGVNSLKLHLERPYWKYDRFGLKDMTFEECSV